MLSNWTCELMIWNVQLYSRFFFFLEFHFSYKLHVVLGLCCSAWQAYEQSQKLCFSRETFNSWAANGEQVEWFQESLGQFYNWKPVLRLGELVFDSDNVFLLLFYLLHWPYIIKGRGGYIELCGTFSSYSLCPVLFYQKVFVVAQILDFKWQPSYTYETMHCWCVSCFVTLN